MIIPEVTALLAKLREEHPNTPDHYWQERREYLVLESRYEALRVGLAELTGWHRVDGAIPVAKIEKLIKEEK